MTLTMFDPWTDLASLRDEMDRLMARAGAPAGAPANVRPPLGVEEDEKGYRLEMDMPGVRRDEIDMHVDGRSLRVCAERFTGRQRCRYERHMTLPDTADTEAIEANLADGVLSILIPKREQARPRRIAIGAGKTGRLGTGDGTDPGVPPA